METELKQQEYINQNIPEHSTTSTTIENSQLQNQPILPPARSSGGELRLYMARISDFLEKLPEYLGQFFNEYRHPILNVGAILAALVGVRILLAILDALNDIPLASPILEMIGIGYTVWFIFRYLLQESTRQELVVEIKSLKKQIFGDRFSEPSS
jgi:hypothetical protein